MHLVVLGLASRMRLGGSKPLLAAGSWAGLLAAFPAGCGAASGAAWVGIWGASWVACLCARLGCGSHRDVCTRRK